MKFFSLFLIALPTIASAFPATTDTSSVSALEHATSNKITGLIQSRDVASLTFCTGPGFTGCEEWFINTGDCAPVPEPFNTNLHSARSSSGAVCFLYTDGNCASCETCADAIGWSNMDFSPVQSFKCVTADASGCSNANCRHI
ncbi:hypothetical protein AMATHDRAFT_87460 [Amanita thiersii Skay4041]|uniref:Uncharacterized protein n=1 Tax=Amanita thiersii Skay4041 TaxID=703135 RepID=A0A2A9NHY4_9AGAR|nr:hypothetical protein AMATHDRAFT_87460 [Amanita thiersii Skay4041]